MMLSARNRSPFTTCQWQELEHQALIYKYMESGVPIPPDLIFPVKRSLDSSRLFPHQPSWGCFQMGFDRKVDPEPGRCRRTDGKKWRCSKEAFPDSKYCERHMHRSRNRSRKPAEANTTQPIPPITKTISPSSYSLSSSMVAETYHHHLHHPYYNNSLHPFIHPNSSSRPQNNTTHLVMNSGSYSQVDENNSKNRYFHGLREVDEHAFFSMDSGSLRNLPNSYLDDSWRMRLQSLTDLSKEQQQQQKEQHFFALGTDFKSERLVKMEKEEEPLRPLRHFFDDLPPKNRDSWHDSVEEGSNQTPFLTTQLSISIPMSSSDFHVSN